MDIPNHHHCRFRFQSMRRDVLDALMIALFLSGVNSTCWRGNAAPVWRSWRLWLENTFRMGSLLQTSWRKRCHSSLWERPCCRTTATLNIQGRFYVSFLPQRKTWLHCAFHDDREKMMNGLRNLMNCLKTQWNLWSCPYIDCNSFERYWLHLILFLLYNMTRWWFAVSFC